MGKFIVLAHDCILSRNAASSKPGAIHIVTEEIGQDKGNDISHAAIVVANSDGTQDFEEIFSNQRLFHEYAMTLGCAHAIARDIEVVRWHKNKTYAWV